MAYSGPAAWYCSSVGWTAVTAWPSNTAVSAGALIRQNAAPTVGNERVFVCIVAGTTTNGTEPTWTVTKGAKTTDNTATWQECTGQPGVNGDISAANCPVWTVSSTPALGLIIYDSVSGSLQICSTSGAGGTGAQPTFSATAGTTTADASATWTSLGLASGFGNVAAPFARLQSVFGTGWWAASNAVFVMDNHAETQASAMTITFQSSATFATPAYVYCMDHTASFPPTNANLKNTATITTTGASTLSLNGAAYIYGITFNCGSGAVTSILTVGLSGSGWFYLDNCVLAKLGTSGNGIAITIGVASATKVTLNNTTMKFSSLTDGLRVQGGNLTWKNTGNPFVSGTLPTNLMGTGLGQGGVVIFDGVDLTAYGTGTTIFSGQVLSQNIILQNCKLAPGVTVTATPQAPNGTTVDVILSDSSGTNYQQQKYRYEGTLVPSTTVVRTGGASDGTTPISHQITTTGNSVWINPFESFQIAEWNTVTGSNRTCTLHGIWNSASLPNNDQVWHDVEYLGSASSPLASFQTGSKANNLVTGTAWTADSSSAWDSKATARQNSTSYSVGNVFSVSTAPGQLFWVISGSGTTAGSIPAGYASCADGATVTDGGYTVRAGVRFTMAVVLSSPQPQLVGYLYSTVKAALASSTFYIDPLLVLS